MQNQAESNESNISTSSKISSEYDLEKFRLFLSGHRLAEIQNKEGVLVLGRMGAGKSSTIAVQLGAKYRYDDIEKNYKVDAQVHTPKTSKGSISTTLNIGPYYDTKNDLLYLDTAGLNESRGKEEDLWTKNNLWLLFTVVRSLKAIVIVIDYSETFRGRDVAIRDLADRISDFTMGDDRFYTNMVFLITNAYERSSLMTTEDVVKKTEEMIVDFTAAEEKLIKSLEKRYPLNSILGFTESFVTNAPSFNIAAVPEADKKLLQSYRDTKKLLSIMMAKKGQNIILSPYLDNEPGQQNIRRLLPQKIHAMRSIQRDVLQDIRLKNMADTRLVFQNTLSSLAANYLLDLSKNVQTMKRLVDFYDENTTILDAIYTNWFDVKRRMLEKNEDELRELNITINKYQREIAQLKTSTKEVAGDVGHIYQKKTFEWMDLISWTWGGSTVNFTYTFPGKQPFLRYEYVDVKDDFKRPPEIIEETPENGKLTIKYESYGGCSLDAKIRVLVYEKDHKDTRERRNVLTEEVEATKKQCEELNRLSQAISATTSKDTLQQVVTSESLEYKRQLEEALLVFNQYIRPNEMAKEWHAIKGLELILQVMIESNALHPDLTPSSKETIRDFLALSHQLKQLSEHRHLKENVPIATKTVEDKLDGSENIPPTNSVYIIQKNMHVFAHDFYKSGRGLFENHPLESGMAASVIGLLMFIKYSRPDPIALMLIATGIFSITSFVRVAVEKKLLNMETNLEEIKRKITAEAQKANVSAVDLGMFAVKELSEKIKIDVDLKSNVKSIFSGVNF